MVHHSTFVPSYILPWSQTVDDFLQEIDFKLVDELDSFSKGNCPDCFHNCLFIQDSFTEVKMSTAFTSADRASVLSAAEAEEFNAMNQLLLELASWLNWWLVAVRTCASLFSTEVKMLPRFITFPLLGAHDKDDYHRLVQCDLEGMGCSIVKICHKPVSRRPI